jgi:hypothetical protein
MGLMLSSSTGRLEVVSSRKRVEKAGSDGISFLARRVRRMSTAVEEVFTTTAVL